MPRTKPNIYDVASAAGVSHQTVSRVINNHPSLRPETRQRVEAAMMNLGYIPNRAARALVTSRSKLIGILVSDVTLFGPAGMLHAIEVEARKSGYVPFAYSVDPNSADDINAGIAHLRELGVDGVILIVPQTLPIDVARAGLPNTPIVTVDSDQQSKRFAVRTDNRGGAQLATQHLIDLGHQQILHITGNTSWTVGLDRQHGYEECMLAAGLQPRVVKGDWQISTGYDIASRYDFSDITGIVCGNDHTALGVLRALRERGIDVPGDISVVGFDDIPEAAFFSPPLTTVRQDFFAIGQQAINGLLGQLEQGEPMESERIGLQLVVRESTAHVRNTR